MADFLDAAKRGDVDALKALLAQEGPSVLRFTGKGTKDAVVGNTARRRLLRAWRRRLRWLRLAWPTSSGR